MSALPYYTANDNATPFPEVKHALKDPDGLLAMGGNLHPDRLLSAYMNGIFPWYNDNEPILWWSPDPRSVILAHQLKLSRSLKKSIRNKNYQITYNKAFNKVLHSCTKPRSYTSDTWINSDMIKAYQLLHHLGYAHSVETWQNNVLVGGLYGVILGKIFFGESMFATQTDASKVAFYHLYQKLMQRNFVLIDCQVESKHMNSLGASNIERQTFISLLNQYCHLDPLSNL